MFIQTKAGEAATELEFYPGCEVFSKGPLAVSKTDAETVSPLAARLYGVDGVETVILMDESVLISRRDGSDWDALRTDIFGAIVAHFQSGDPAVISEDEGGEFDTEIIEQVKDLLNTRILPAVTQSGGDIAFHSYKAGTLYLKMQGSAFSMITGITNMLKHYIPEIDAIADHREALDRPGLTSTDGVAIRELLKDRVNPSIASHGGLITLVDVKDNKVYVRLEGGCQGCGMADVTLKQGVAKEIMDLIPSITEVLDVTDHAGGNNPYYQPS